jgi:hypothetical protein
MQLLSLTLLYCLITFSSGDPALKFLPATATNGTTRHLKDSAFASVSKLILQSKDGGLTWQDISMGLPVKETPESFFAGESNLYLRIRNDVYKSKTNLAAPVWEKDNTLDPRSTWNAFKASGVMAYNSEEKFFQIVQPIGTWVPLFTNVKKPSVLTVFQTSEGTLFAGCEDGLYISSDKGQTWKQVVGAGWVRQFVEADGILIATSQTGIMRSTDDGKTWESVINEGGVGIAVERIDGGFAAIAFNTKINARRIHISSDGGKTWKTIDDGLRPALSISSVKQVGKYLVCGHPDGIYRSSDKGKTWTVVLPDKDSGDDDGRGNVFRLYVSGGVVYAIAGGGGC